MLKFVNSFLVNKMFIYLYSDNNNIKTHIMKPFKTFEVAGIKREYFILDNKKALQLGWKFQIEVKTTSDDNNVIVRNRYFTSSELDINNGINYWSKYERN